MRARISAFAASAMIATMSAQPVRAADCNAIGAAADKIANKAEKLATQAENSNPESDNDLLCAGAKGLQGDIKAFIKKHGAESLECGVDPADLSGLEKSIRNEIIVQICR